MLVSGILERLGVRRSRVDREDHQTQVQEAIGRLRLAELELQQATSLEALDLARARIVAAQYELQQLIRAAKRERGITLRPIAEVEANYLRMLQLLFRRSEGTPPYEPLRLSAQVQKVGG